MNKQGKERVLIGEERLKIKSLSEVLEADRFLRRA